MSDLDLASNLVADHENHPTDLESSQAPEQQPQHGVASTETETVKLTDSSSSASPSSSESASALSAPAAPLSFPFPTLPTAVEDKKTQPDAATWAFHNLVSFRNALTALTKQLSDESLRVLPLLSHCHALYSAAFALQLRPVSEGEQKDEADEKAYQHALFQASPKIASAILSRTYPSSDVVMAAVLAVCASLEHNIQRALGATELSLSAAETLVVLWDETKVFHQQFGSDIPVATTTTTDTSDGSDGVEVADETPFRSQIEIGQWLDLFEKGLWKPAQVIDMDNQQIRLSYDGGNKYTSDHVGEWLPLDSSRLAPLRSKSLATTDPWRIQLEVGGECDGCDTVKKWYTCHIVEVDREMVKITYDGWGNQYDEWLPRSSDRLAAHLSIAKGGREAGGVSAASSASSKSFDDSEDPEDQAVVFRGRTFNSYTSVQLMQYFAQIGGFDSLLARLSPSHTDPASAPLVRKITEAIHKCHNSFTRPFLKPFILSLHQAVSELFRSYNDHHLRMLARDDLEAVAKVMEGLLTRGHGTPVAMSQTEKFMLDVSIKRFRCPMVERRLNGLQYIQDLTNAISKGNYRCQGWLTPKILVEWLSEQQVLEGCLTIHHPHPEMIKKAADLVKFLCSERMMTSYHMDLVWNCLKSAMIAKDNDALSALYKLLEDIAWQLSNDHVLYLFAKLRGMPAHEHTPQSLELARELCRWSSSSSSSSSSSVSNVPTAPGADQAQNAVSQNSGTASEQALELFWSVLQDGSGADGEVATAAKSRMEDVLALSYVSKSRVAWLVRFTNSIKEGKSVVQSLQLICKVVDSYPEFPTMMEKHTEADAVHFLQSNHNLYTIFFDNLIQWKDAAVEALSNNPNADLYQLKLQDSRFGLLASLDERLRFLQFTLSRCPLLMGLQQGRVLWAVCVASGLGAAVSECFLKFLRRSLRPASPRVRIANMSPSPPSPQAVAFAPIFDDEVLQWLFDQCLIPSLQFESVTITQYMCFEALFLHVNKHQGMLSLSSSSNSNSSPRFVVHNFKLSGLDSLWNLALDARDEGVATAAMAFLNQLHECLSPQLQGHVADIRADFVGKCMAHYKEFLSADDVSAGAGRVERCLKLLVNILDASEQHGLGGLEAHGSGAKGMPVKISVQNKVHGSSKASQFSFRMHSNDTLLRLKMMVSQELDISMGSLLLVLGGRTLPAEDHAKTLSELGVQGDRAALLARTSDFVEKRDPLVEDGRLTPGFERVLTNWWLKYSRPRPLSREMDSKAVVPYVAADADADADANADAGAEGEGVDVVASSSSSSASSEPSQQNERETETEAEQDKGQETDDVRQGEEMSDREKERQILTELASPEPEPEQQQPQPLEQTEGHKDSDSDNIPAQPQQQDQQQQQENQQQPQQAESDPYANNVMTEDDVLAFVVDCQGGSANHKNPNDRTLTYIFRKFMDDEGYMSRDAFFGFYRDAVDDRANVVWTDMKGHGYRYDLRTEAQVMAQERQSMTSGGLSLPRALLSSFPAYFSLLFASLSHPHLPLRVREKVWGLLQRLPTNPHMLTQLKSIASDQGSPDWSALLDATSVYKLLYTLQIVERLMNAKEHSQQQQQPSPQQEEQERWNRAFLEKGGFNHVYNILMQYTSLPASPLSVEVLALLSHLTSSFLLPALASQNENLAQDICHKIESIDQALSRDDDDEEEEEDNLSLKQKEKEKEEAKETQAVDAITVNNHDDQLTVTVNGETYTVLEDALQALDLTSSSSPSSSVAVDEKKQEEKEQEKEKEKEKEEPLVPPGLLRSLSVNQANRVLQTVNFEALVKVMLELVKMAASEDELASSASASSPVPSPSSSSSSSSTVLSPSSSSSASSSASASTSALSPALIQRLGSSALRLLSVCVFQNTPRMLPLVSELVQAHPSSYLLRPLLCASSASLRRHTAFTLAAFAQDTSVCGVLLDLLLSHLPSSPANAECLLQCDQLFLLVRRLIRVVDAAPAGTEKKMDLSALCERLAGVLLSSQSNERLGCAKVDRVMLGLLNTLADLIQDHPDRQTQQAGLLAVLFNDFLFALPDEDASSSSASSSSSPSSASSSSSSSASLPRCHSDASRFAAMKLIVALCSHHSNNLQSLLKLLSEQSAQVSKLNVWDYAPDKLAVSPLGYVGLRNLGATCYMNSLVQQFFMIPEFRLGLLSAVDKEENQDEALLFQLQRVFGFLSGSKKQAYDTTPFVCSYKDIDGPRGRPINPRIQQDAQEFLTSLFDRLEKRLKGSPQEKLLKDVFGGKVTNQLICRGRCKSIRERPEDFFTISLEVKNKSGLSESLRAHVAGELLQDFRCDSCNARVEIDKRQVLSELSNTVVFHLKRFELDFQTFQHEKVNSRFEFPLRLNLEPFTKEGVARMEQEEKAKKDPSLTLPARYSVRPQEYYDYRLVGVIIHTGTAQAGHYYSFIRERNASVGPLPSFSSSSSASSSVDKEEENKQQQPDTEAEKQQETEKEEESEENKNGGNEEDAKTAALQRIEGQLKLQHEQAVLDEKTKEEEEKQAGAGRWLEFNDHQVRPFVLTEMEEQCFGGEDLLAEKTGWEFETGPAMKVKNAYMLVYERVQHQPPHTEETEKEKSEDKTTATITTTTNNNVTTTSDNDSDNQVVYDLSARSTAYAITNSTIKAAVEADNRQFALDRQVFNSHYFAFITRLLKVMDVPSDAEQANELVDFLIEFLFEVMARGGDKTSLPLFIPRFLALLGSSASSAAFAGRVLDYMSTRPALLADLLLSNRQSEIRSAVGQLVVKCCEMVVKEEEEEKKLMAEDEVHESGQARAVSSVVRYLQTHMSLLEEAAKQWVRFSEYFEVLHGVSQLPSLRLPLGARFSLLPVLLDVFLAESSPIKEEVKTILGSKNKRASIGSKMAAPDWLAVLKAVHALAMHTDFATNDRAAALSLTALKHRDFLKMIVSIPVERQPQACLKLLSDMLCRICRDERDVSVAVMTNVLSAINKAGADNVEPLLALLAPLLRLDDALHLVRVSEALSSQHGVLSSLSSIRHHSDRMAYMVVKFLTEMMEKDEAVRDVMVAHRAEWTWVDGFLKDYIHKQRVVAYGRRQPPTLARQQSRQTAFNRYEALLSSLSLPLVFASPAPQNPILLREPGASQSADLRSNDGDGESLYAGLGSGDRYDTIYSNPAFKNRNRKRNTPAFVPASHLSQRNRLASSSAGSSSSSSSRVSFGKHRRLGEEEEERENDDVTAHGKRRLTSSQQAEREGEGEGDSYNQRAPTPLLGNDYSYDHDDSDLDMEEGLMDKGQFPANLPAVHSEGTNSSNNTNTNTNTSGSGSSNAEWACDTCTFLNPARMFMCDMCGSAR